MAQSPNMRCFYCSHNVCPAIFAIFPVNFMIVNMLDYQSYYISSPWSSGKGTQFRLSSYTATDKDKLCNDLPPGEAISSSTRPKSVGGKD
ncbi:hypothetical protein TNCV_4434741 [Trichonephila clavipes]|nr:hypothetical protein TNCV_4434741 [Trichonephila clavipes]